jgi:hypothetical protein
MDLRIPSNIAIKEVTSMKRVGTIFCLPVLSKLWSTGWDSNPRIMALQATAFATSPPVPYVSPVPAEPGNTKPTVQIF